MTSIGRMGLSELEAEDQEDLNTFDSIDELLAVDPGGGGCGGRGCVAA